MANGTNGNGWRKIGGTAAIIAVIFTVLLYMVSWNRSQDEAIAAQEISKVDQKEYREDVRQFKAEIQNMKREILAAMKDVKLDCQREIDKIEK